MCDSHFLIVIWLGTNISDTSSLHNLATIPIALCIALNALIQSRLLKDF